VATFFTGLHVDVAIVLHTADDDAAIIALYFESIAIFSWPTVSSILP
jgi:hypothetical protein